MKNILLQLSAAVLLSVSLLSCKKDYDGLGPLEDSVAEIPVTVVNADFFERFPIIRASLAAGTAPSKGPFSITFEIPSDKGTIAEISKVAIGTTGLNILNARPATELYNYSPTTMQATVVQGTNTNRITFTSSLEEYTRVRTRLGNPTSMDPATVAMTTGANPVIDERNPRQLRFFFVLKLADGSELIPMETRVRVQP